MCGNGSRCVCKYAFDHGTTFANPMRIQTGAGVLSLEHEQGDDGLVEMVTVDMGSPRWHADEVGVSVEEPGKNKSLVGFEAERNGLQTLNHTALQPEFD